MKGCTRGRHTQVGAKGHRGSRSLQPQPQRSALEVGAGGGEGQADTGGYQRHTQVGTKGTHMWVSKISQKGSRSPQLQRSP